MHSEIATMNGSIEKHLLLSQVPNVKKGEFEMSELQKIVQHILIYIYLKENSTTKTSMAKQIKFGYISPNGQINFSNLSFSYRFFWFLIIKSYPSCLFSKIKCLYTNLCSNQSDSKENSNVTCGKDKN